MVNLREHKYRVQFIFAPVAILHSRYDHSNRHRGQFLFLIASWEKEVRQWQRLAINHVFVCPTKMSGEIILILIEPLLGSDRIVVEMGL